MINTYWRMGEDNTGNVVIVKLESGLVVKESVRQSSTSSNGHWSEQHLASHVTQSIDTGQVSVLILVDHHVTSSVQLQTNILTPQTVSVGSATHGPEQDIRWRKNSPIVESDQHTLASPVNTAHLDILDDVDTTVLHLFSHCLTDLE